MDIQEALRIGFFQLWLNVPHFILCCVPFFHKLRIRRRWLALIVALTGLAIASYYALRETLFPGLRAWNDAILIGFHLIYLLLYRRLFGVAISKLLYILLMVDAYSVAINVIMKFADVSIYPEHVSQMTATSYSLMVIGALALTMPFVWRFFRGILRRAFEKLPDKGFWKFCIVPALFFLVNQVYTNLLYGRMFRQTGKLDTQTFLIFLMVLTAEFVVYVLTLYTALDTARRVRLESEVEGMRSQLAIQVRSYAQLTESIETARAARHDLRHHLAAIAAYVEKNDKEGLSAYLEEYRNSLPDEKMGPICRNYAVDVVVRYYLQQAMDVGAEIDVKLELPERVGIPDSDLTIIFGNLFENAVLAVVRQTGGKRFITARCILRNGMLILALDNSMEPEPGQSGRRQPYKGVGQTSVEGVVQKYCGTVRFEAEKDIYRVSVLLYLNHREETEPVDGKPLP